MEMQCPGRRDRDLDSSLVRCPKCHEVVEIFTDEQKVRCRCGNVIFREAVPSCIMWCPAAERCLGSVIDLREVRKRIEAMHADADAHAYVTDIQRKIRHAGKKKDPHHPARTKSEALNARRNPEAE